MHRIRPLFPLVRRRACGAPEGTTERGDPHPLRSEELPDYSTSCAPRPAAVMRSSTSGDVVCSASRFGLPLPW